MAALDDWSSRPPRTANDDGYPDPEESSSDQDQRRKKPSYVGLSCSVSGYNDYIRYTSPDGRKTTPPAQIPVSSPPQTLNSVSLMLHHDNAMLHSKVNGHRQSHLIGHYQSNSVTSSPYSDSGESSESPGNLVQKQIERLYGSKARTVRNSTSPESKVYSPDFCIRSPESDESSVSTPECKHYGSSSDGGFFTKRFGIARQRDRHTANDSKLVDEEHSRSNGISSIHQLSSSSPLDFEPLKVPAVFRLLRPEFREQLKASSCQIPNDRTSIPSPLISPSKKTNPERIIPVQRENGSVSPGRLIPVVKERRTFAELEKVDATTKIEADAVRKEPKCAGNESSKKLLSSPTHKVQSPTLVSKFIKKSNTYKSGADEVDNAKIYSSITSSISSSPPVPARRESQIKEAQNGHGEKQSEELPINEEDVLETYERVGGVHEIAELSTIIEEDNESTASGSQLNLAKSSNLSVAPPATERDPNIHDGHYFIKLLENEIFKFEEYICDFEEELSDNSIPAEVRDSILAAIGKAKLLMAQKLAQFRGLCEKNITLTVEQDPFVPTTQDLEGFWDMVYIQVEHIHSLFAELSELRKNDWKKTETYQQNVVTNSKPERKPRTKVPKANPVSSKATSDVVKARNEARRKMLEEKKRQMKQKMVEESKKNGEKELFVEL